MDLETALFETEEAMEKGVEFLQHEFASVRTGKATPSLVEGIDIHVHSYGSTMKLKQLGTISAPEARLIVIQPFDPSTTHDIERGLRESRLGINPAVDGRVIRLPIPELSEERRRDMVKVIKQMAEESRVRIRAARKEGLEKIRKLQKDKLITEDDLERNEKEIQTMTDKCVKQVDDHLASKEKELMTV